MNRISSSNLSAISDAAEMPRDGGVCSMRDIMIAKNVKAIIGDGYRMDKGDSELKHER